uniref:MYND-type domain-containing protein n=1 Tax=Psilocybe cubensis TaxID=181762 RepID=A0A8H8CRD5_PSICU
MVNELACSVCHTKADSNTAIQRCSKCHSRLYCGTTCQREDWPTHRRACGKTLQWYDKFRKCRDGSLHEGKLELITWPCPEEGTGWGGCLAEESDALKRKFEVKYGSDEATLHKHWPQGFRWTCCGTDAGMDWGCDHHGTGSKPCTCDFCRCV